MRLRARYQRRVDGWRHPSEAESSAGAQILQLQLRRTHPVRLQVFEKQVRRGVDPGLIEQVGALMFTFCSSICHPCPRPVRENFSETSNIYKTRIYPLFAGQSRTIRIDYLSDLPLSAATRTATYSLPLAQLSPDPVPSFHFSFHGPLLRWLQDLRSRVRLRSGEPRWCWRA